jgi:Na+-transporting methylmalonyl-CoA/oxaloacetate decarboxylase gamma subunit
MENLDKLFVRYSIALGGFGLTLSLRELGLSFIAIVGFVITFCSILSVLMSILSVLETRYEERHEA